MAEERQPFDNRLADGMMASRTTYYAALYPRLREVAYQHGYALCLHGTLAKDLDVVAIPWTDEASSEEELVAALVERTGGALGTGPEYRTPKPHGRGAWVISLLGGGGYVDLSVMPRVDTDTDTDTDGDGDVPTFTAEMKLQALALRFYAEMPWDPKPGDYYTSSREDLELYRVVDVTEDEVVTRYVLVQGKPVADGLHARWDRAGFTTEGFGSNRVHVPRWVLGLPEEDR